MITTRLTGASFATIAPARTNHGCVLQCLPLHNVCCHRDRVKVRGLTSSEVADGIEPVVKHVLECFVSFMSVLCLNSDSMDNIF
eukprot:SAG31_NODE_1322_length_8786_cov_2.268576_4_plen_84_part_00